MSAETSAWLNSNIAVGFTKKRGSAWWLRADDAPEGWTSHYADAVPENVALELLGRVDPVMVTPEYDWRNPLTPSVDGCFDCITLNTGFACEGHRDVIRKSATDQGFIINRNDGALLGAHTSGYAIHSYTEWLYQAAGKIIGEGLQIGQCGLLKNGAQAWVSFELPDTVEYKRTGMQGIEFRPQLLCTTALDGSLATTYKMVFTIVVCDNTRTMALSENGAVYRVKHTKNSEVKIANAREALDITYAMADDFSKELEKMLSTKVSTKQWDAFKELFVPRPEDKGRGQTMADNKRDELNELYETDPMCQPWSGTAYGVQQTVNTWAHHKAIVRKVNRAERNMQNALTGKTGKLDAEVWETLNKVLTGASA